MPEFLNSMPFFIAFSLLAVGVFIRGHVTYSIAKFVTELALKHSAPREKHLAYMHNWLQGGGADRGISLLQRWGLVAVPLCYLTVGLQTMVLAGAGVLRIPRWKFALAQIPGALAWAAIYSTIGFAAFRLAFAAATGSVYGLATIGVLVLLLLGYIGWRLHRRQSLSPRPASTRPRSQTSLPAPSQDTDFPAN